MKGNNSARSDQGVRICLLFNGVKLVTCTHTHKITSIIPPDHLLYLRWSPMPFLCPCDGTTMRAYTCTSTQMTRMQQSHAKLTFSNALTSSPNRFTRVLEFLSYPPSPARLGYTSVRRTQCRLRFRVATIGLGHACA